MELATTGYDVVDFDILLGMNILDADAVRTTLQENVDAVIHIAAQADLTQVRGFADGFDTTQLNVGGTHNLVDVCARRGIWFIYASTCCVYGNQPGISNEDLSVPKPCELYAFTKLAGEQVVRGYGANFGLPYTILRLATVYGPGMRKTLAPYVFLDQASRGADITIHGTGEQTRAETFVKDLAQGIVTTLSYPQAKGQVINLATRETISVKQMAEQIRHRLGSRSKIVHVDDRANQIYCENFDVEKAVRILNWQAQTSWERGLDETVAWFKAERHQV